MSDADKEVLYVVEGIVEEGKETTLLYVGSSKEKAYNVNLGVSFRTLRLRKLINGYTEIARLQKNNDMGWYSVFNLKEDLEIEEKRLLDELRRVRAKLDLL